MSVYSVIVASYSALNLLVSIDVITATAAATTTIILIITRTMFMMLWS